MARHLDEAVDLPLVGDSLGMTVYGFDSTLPVTIRTIGIGGSPACDGQILVIDDMLGLFAEFTPKFVKRYRGLGDEIGAAAREYAEDVRHGRFPAEEHTYPAPKRAKAAE